MSFLQYISVLTGLNLHNLLCKIKPMTLMQDLVFARRVCLLDAQILLTACSPLCLLSTCVTSDLCYKPCCDLLLGTYCMFIPVPKKSQGFPGGSGVVKIHLPKKKNLPASEGDMGLTPNLGILHKPWSN